MTRQLALTTSLPEPDPKPLAPRNVVIERTDGTRDVVPVRNLRRKKPR